MWDGPKMFANDMQSPLRRPVLLENIREYGTGADKPVASIQALGVRFYFG